MAQLPKMDPQKTMKAAIPLLGAGLTLAGVSYAANNALYNVDAGHRAIKFHRVFGIGKETYEEGTHLMLPWFERPIIFDIRTRPRTIVSLTGSRDLQMVNISVRTLCKPDKGKLQDIYCELGMNYDEKVLPSIVNETLKSVVAQFDAKELVKQREQVSALIRKGLTKRAADFNILLEDVSITHLNFSAEYERAVESKQVAQQQAERAKYKVLKAQEEKKSTIIKAEGEKAAAEMIGNAMKENPGFIELRKIENAREIAATVSKGSNKAVLSSDTLMLNLFGGKNTELNNQ